MVKRVELKKATETESARQDFVKKGSPEPENEKKQEDVENFNTRLIAGLHIEMKIHCVKNRIKIQDFVNKAIKEKLEASK